MRLPLGEDSNMKLIGMVWHDMAGILLARWHNNSKVCTSKCRQASYLLINALISPSKRDKIIPTGVI